MKLSLIAPVFTTVALLTACASTGTIAPQYVSPANYRHHDCSTLEREVERISAVAAATEKQNVGLSATGIGIGVVGGRHGIYPSVSFGVGTGSSQRNAKQGQLSRLYGEHDAMVIAAREKGCTFAQGIKIYGE